MKKIISIVVACVMMLTLMTGCGSSRENCTVAGCANEAYSKGLCPEHYVESAMTGGISASVPVEAPQNAENVPATEAAVMEEAMGGSSQTAADMESGERRAYDQVISMGEAYENGFVNMIFDSWEIAEDARQTIVTNNNVGTVSRTFGPEPMSGMKYLVLYGTITNLANTDLPIYDFFIGTITVDGNMYSVNANDCTIYNKDTGKTESSYLGPKITMDIVYYLALPDMLAASPQSIDFEMGFYDMFDNVEMSYNKSFEKDPVPMCPYFIDLIIH